MYVFPLAACERVIKPKGLLALAVGAAALVGGACRRPVVGLPLLVLGLAVAGSSRRGHVGRRREAAGRRGVESIRFHS